MDSENICEQEMESDSDDVAVDDVDHEQEEVGQIFKKL